jgi:predicted dehydrogenase
MSTTVLIVGLGEIGMGYDLHLDPTTHIYSHSRAFSQHPKFNLVGGVDSDKQKCQTFTRTYGCTAYVDLETALEQHQPELVIVAVPTLYHSQTLQRVLERSQPKIILCEKPLSYNPEEARDMLKACATRDIKLYVNYMRRSDPGVIEIKRRIMAGEFDVPIKGVVWYSKGFLHSGSHFFNMLEFWLGKMQDSAVINRGRLWDDADPEPDVHVTFEFGNIMFLAAREEAFSHYTVELLSPNGRLRYEQGGELIQWQLTQPDPYFQGYTILSTKPETISSDMNRYQWHVAEQLARVLDGQEAHLCSGTDALHTLKNMKQILG